MDKEPALIIGLAQAVIALVIAFGIPLSQAQAGAIMGVVAAVLAVVATFIVRSQVTPNSVVRELRGELVDAQMTKSKMME